MRRAVVEALGLWSLLLVVLLAWAGAEVWSGAAAPGTLAGRLVWQSTLLNGLFSGTADWITRDVEPPLWTGLPVVVSTSLMARVLAMPLAASVATMGWLAAGPATLWAVARHRGAGALAAAGAAVVGGLSPVVLGGLTDGRVECLAVPLVVAALVGATSTDQRLRGLGFACTVLAGTFHIGLGVATALAAVIAGGGGLSLLAGLGALAVGTVNPDSVRQLAVQDIATPFLSFRRAAEAPGLGGLLALVWFLPASPLRRAAILGFAFALGPVLPYLGVLDFGLALPVPGLLLGLVAPGVQDWSGGLVVAATAVGLALGRPGFATATVLFPLVTLVEALKLTGGALPTTALEPPLVIADLAGRTGGVVHLPVEVSIPSLPDLVGAPPGSNALFLSFQPSHGRPLLHGVAPLGARSTLYSEPGVVLLLDLVGGAGTLLVPPLQPGDALRGLGVTDLLVHRGRLAESTLAALEPVYARWYGPPQRDLAAGVDLYRVPDTGARYPASATPIHRVGDSAAVGWKTTAEYLAERGLRPNAAPGGARPAGVGPGKPGGAGGTPGQGKPGGGAPGGGAPGGGAPGGGAPGGGAPGGAAAPGGARSPPLPPRPLAAQRPVPPGLPRPHPEQRLRRSHDERRS